MYFFVDSKDQSIIAFGTLGEAARAAFLKVTGCDMPDGIDPVSAANKELGDRGALLNISAAFESVEESEEAQELAKSFRVAVNRYYRSKK